ncbi:MAG: hypothetical protein IT214_05470 [Chitinophagaceae bacterium]|nr:hypothetical protein [Chitinophagaceae bacterium]
MKKVFLFFAYCTVAIISHAQKENFDMATYNVPAGWKKIRSADALQFSKEDEASGAYCLITLYKSVPGTANAKENFDMAWASLVKEMVTVSAAPEMQPPALENGWEAQSGYAPFEADGNKGLAILVTSSGFDKMVNLMILTNTDVYEKEMTAFIESITLKKLTATTTQQQPKETNTTSITAVSNAKNDGYAFNTTNFDDGWKAVVKEDWVEVTKGEIKVLLHYPKEGTIFPADPEPLTNAAWNILVVPRYSSLKDYRTAYISTYNRPYLGFSNATNNEDGKGVFVVLFRQGESGWIEFICPNKNTFIQNFMFDPYTIKWDSETDLMNSLSAMKFRNKFAIATADFKGKWTNDFTGVQQLYHVYTGNYAGMNIHQSNQLFHFGAGNTYKWKLMVVSGMVGNTKYQQVESAGTFTVINNWQIRFSKMENKTKTYHAYWSCIKGARLLNLLDAEYPGSGMYDVFGMSK